MARTTLEDLPNDIWLELFVYFTWIELSTTWLKWQFNTRITTLAQMAHARVAFDISTLSKRTYAEILHYFEHQHFVLAHRITSLVFDENLLSMEITSRWLQNGSSFLPRIRRWTIFIDLIGRYVSSRLVRLILQCASTLHRLTLFFNERGLYKYILGKLIEHRVSLHTMQLIIVEDQHYLSEGDLNLHKFSACHHLLAFPRTVRFRLLLQRLSELALLLQRGALPYIQHLHITLEELENDRRLWWTSNDGSPRCTLSPNDLHINRADVPNLRTLHLQQVPMNGVLVLMEHLTSMVRLESLILIDCHVKDRDELIAFKTGLKTYLLCLRQLQFVLYLSPVTILNNSNDLYWYNLGHSGVKTEINDDAGLTVLLLYTLPYILNMQRAVCNHTFLQRSPINKMCNCIRWTVNRDPLSLKSSLAQFRNVDSLTLSYCVKTMCPYPKLRPWNLILTALRRAELSFDDDNLVKPFTPITHRLIILEQIRICAPSLQCLTLSWHDIMLILLSESDVPWPNVEEFHARLRIRHEDDLSATLVGRLASSKMFPRLRYLSFSGPRRFKLAPPELLAERILAWVDVLLSSSSTFLMLHVNRRCAYYKTRPVTSRDTLMTLLKQHARLNDRQHVPTRVIIDSNEEILIWL